MIEPPPLITSCWEAFVKSASAVWFYCPSSAQVSWLYGGLPHLHWAFSLCAFALATSAALSLDFVISVPLFRLSTHCFHVLQLSFSILTCLAHFSVTLKWIPISPSRCSRFTHRTQFFCITRTLIISIATFPLALRLSVARLMKFVCHLFLSDPEQCDAGGVFWRFPRILHGRGADGVDQTDGGGVLACDGGLHRGGLAPGLQLGSVKSREEEVVKKFSVDSMKFKERQNNVFKMLMEILRRWFHRHGSD